MSKQSNLLSVVCVSVLLLQALLAGDLQLVAAAAQIGDEFLCQDPIRGPSSVMLSHASRDELNSASAAPAFTREEGEVVGEEAFSVDEYAGDDEDEEVLFVGDKRARDPHRSADEEELVDDDENSLLGAQGSAADGSYDSEELGSSGGGDVQCPECGKRFRSDKSMFGHLRSHPDRGYKGATPPAKPKLLPSHNAASSLTPVKDERAVKDDRPVARYSQRDPNLNTFEILAAYVMLTLKHRDNRIAQDQSVNVKRELDVAPKEDSVMSKSGDDVALGDKNGSPAAEMAGDDVVCGSEHGSSAAEMAGGDHPLLHSEHGSSAIEVPTKRGRTKKSKEAHRKEKDVASASKARRPYICKHCQVVFPTHQALGGHMAAHNKDRRVQAQNEQAAAWEAHHQGQSSLNRQEPKGGGGEEEHRGGGLSAATRKLLMERYTMLFNQGGHSKETGGGYKRKHTERKDGGAVPVAPPVADGDRHRLFDVDLNARAPKKE